MILPRVFFNQETGEILTLPVAEILRKRQMKRVTQRKFRSTLNNFI